MTMIVGALSVLCAAVLVGSCEAVPQQYTFANNPTTAPSWPHDSRNLKTIAFGSCSARAVEQPVWEGIGSTHADLFVYLGDVVYLDKKVLPHKFVPATLDEMHASYSRQLARPDYQAFLKSMPTIATWDDHDFGINNGGRHYADKAASQQMFLNFIGEPLDTPRRRREGVYTSYTFGSSYPIIKFILLDARYNRDRTNSGRADRDLLGEEQWQWLESELLNSTADVNIIGSGIQVLVEDRVLGENWLGHPAAHERLLRLIAQQQSAVAEPGLTFIISGDVHYAETHYECLSRYVADGSKHVPPPVVEVTSSGMTHSCRTQLPYGLCEFVFAAGYPTSVSKVGERFFDINFGTITVDLPQGVAPHDVATLREQGSLVVRIHDKGGASVAETRLPLHGRWEPRAPDGQALPACPQRGRELLLWNTTRAVVAAVLLLVVLCSPLVWGCCAACKRCRGKTKVA